MAEIGRAEPMDGNDKIRGCLMGTPGRGDCAHFVKLPAVENTETVDVYGVPHGWCIVCWQAEIIKRLHERLRVLRYGVK